MTRAILVCMHSYTPYGQEYYTPILDFFLQQMKKFDLEYDQLYLIEDDNWRLDPAKLEGMRAQIVHVDSSLRYYDAYKTVLPQVKEDLVLFLDDDMVIYKPGKIGGAFMAISQHYSMPKLDWEPPLFDVISITDTIGTMQVPLKTGNKLCPYFFATRKELLMKYLDIDWGPEAMPYTETFGLLTEAMLKDGLTVYEMPDDKDSLLFEGVLKTDGTQDLGYYHIRAGSTPAYLLAEKTYGNMETYDSYLKNQPESELLRHCAWYQYMGGNPTTIIQDLRLEPFAFKDYYNQFIKYHGLL